MLLFRDHTKVDDYLGIDLENIKKTYDLLATRLQHWNITERLNSGLFRTLLSSLPRSIPGRECMRVFCFLMANPSLRKFPECVEIIVPFIKAFLNTSDQDKEIVSKYIVW